MAIEKMKDLKQQAAAANAQYQKDIKQYSGENGYNSSLKMAEQGAGTIASNSAQGAIDKQNTAARTNGMGGNAAAIMAGNNAATTYNDAYLNSFNTQQGQAAQQNANALNASQANMQSQYERMNKEREFRTNLGLGIAQSIVGAAGAGAQIASLFSDENTKTDIKQVTGKIDGLLKKHYKKNYKDLIISDEKKKEKVTAIGDAAQSMNSALEAAKVKSDGNVFSNRAGEIVSDRNEKECSKTKCHISDMLDNIDGYLFKYKKDAQEKHPDMTDDKEHLGVMAQDLADNPLTESAVIETEDGTLAVDTRQMAMIDMALIKDLSDRIKALEERL